VRAIIGAVVLRTRLSPVARNVFTVLCTQSEFTGEMCISRTQSVDSALSEHKTVVTYGTPCISYRPTRAAKYSPVLAAASVRVVSVLRVC
jgi:hypothetical protein